MEFSLSHVSTYFHGKNNRVIKKHRMQHCTVKSEVFLESQNRVTVLDQWMNAKQESANDNAKVEQTSMRLN
jgi:uncharacterized membrane protein YdbT with pleckstrin-like domain